MEKDVKEISVKQLMNRYKQKAKKRNFVWELDIIQFKKLIFSNCRYCNSEFLQSYNAYATLLGKYNSRNHERCESAKIKHNGVDRINSKLGYIIDNCVPCCKICNYAKNSLTIEEFYNWVQKIHRNFKL